MTQRWPRSRRGWTTTDAVLVAPRLVMVLQSIRSHFGAAVTINSGYRTPDYNAKVGGVAHSQHCYGTAADIVVKGKTPTQVAAYAREIMPDWGGVGIYAKQGFTHIDVREARAADGLTMDDAMDIILSHHGVEAEIDTIWNSIIL